MHKGQVIFFLQKRGYGYIRQSDSLEEFHVHHKNLLMPIKDGDFVEFEIKKSKQGLIAVKVAKLEG